MMGGSLLGVIVNFSVVLVTELLLLCWQSHLVQSSLSSREVLGLLLLGFFVVEHLDSLKVRMTFRLFHFGVWFVDLLRPAFGITPFLVLPHGDTALKKDVL
jgi:hypothetical protein